MSPRAAVLALLPCLSYLSCPVNAQELGLDAQLNGDMLPRGRHAVRLELRHGEASKIFNERGADEPVFADFDHVNLNTVFAAPFSLGTTQFRAQLAGERYRLTYGYGFGENLTAGFVLGWGELRNAVDFAVVNASPLLANPSETLQASLTGAPYFYKRIASVTTQGLLDPVLGLRWRIAHGEGWSTILSPALRIGMAQKDDPDNLLDVHLEDGSNDLQLGLEHYRALPAGWEMRAAAQYTWQLPDHVRARPYAAGALPLVPQAASERLGRDLGDVLQVDVEAARRVGDWRFTGRLEYSRDSADDYYSARGQDVSGLEANTAGWAANLWLGVSWSGIRRYLETRRGLPAIVTLQYRTVLDGRNAVQSSNLFLTATLPF